MNRIEPDLRALADALAATFSDDVALFGDAIEDRYCHDWSGLPPVRPLALVRPRTAEEVAETIRLCRRLRIPLVPQGGLTGLAGGAHPVAGALALSLERLRGIEAIDPVMGTMTVLAGTPLAEIQAAAENAGLAFALDLGARGSCTIGGNLATNAGGNRVIRYGMARDQVLGLEYVLADGTLVSSLNKMIKNNAGFDLKHLFIGSEGTLGIITRAVLKLQARPLSVATALCGCPDFGAVLRLLQSARAMLGPSLSAFEVMWPSFVDTMTRGLPGLRKPFDRPMGLYVLAEASGFTPAVEAGPLEALLGGMIGDGTVVDAVIATTERDTRDLWAIRDSPSEYSRVLGPIIGFDIGLPTSRMGEAVAAIHPAVESRWPDARILCYGHIGDSNLHVVINIPSAGAAQPQHDVDQIVYGIVRAFDGTISAEHGIGLIKKPFLAHTRSPEEVALMRRLKAMMDPDNLLNPGKVL